MTKNWVEEVVEEINRTPQNVPITGDDVKKIILSHAPVIDAERIAKKLLAGTKVVEMWEKKYACITNDPEYIAQLISDAIDLNIEWVDGKAEWGQFNMQIIDALDGRKSIYEYRLFLRSYVAKAGRENKKELAQQACEKALRGIITGVKE